MWFETIILFLLCVCYFLLYVDMKININDTVSHFEKHLTRKNINEETFLKSPFYFDGTHIVHELKESSFVKEKKRKGKYEIFNKIYEPYPLLEPNIRYETENKIYNIHKALPLISNSCSVNYYIVKEGKCNVTFIHPRFKESFWENDELIQKEAKIDYIKKQSHFNTTLFSKNSIIYVPNDWILYIEKEESSDAKDKCVIESIHYFTLCNQFIGWIKKNLINTYKKL